MGAGCGQAREETEIHIHPTEAQSMAQLEAQNTELQSRIAELESQLTEFQQETDAISQRPSGMALLKEVTDAMRARQLSAPEKWTMTCRKWIQFVEHCIGLDEFKQAKRRNRCTKISTNLLF